MIKKLTPDQEALIPQVRDEWVRFGLSTERVDRPAVRKILERLYGQANKPAPKFVIHLGSPLRVAIAIAQLRLGDKDSRAQVSDQVSDQVRAQVSAQVSDQVGAQVRDQVGDQVGDQVSDLMNWRWWWDFGQFDAAWNSWLDFFARIGFADSRCIPLFEMSKSCGWSLLFWDWAFVSDRPERIHRDEQNRLHAENGPAIRYPDGFSVFAIHGVRVPEKVVVAPETLQVSEIDGEQNAEVRRVMIERYGQDHYLMDSKAQEIHRDDFGVLYRKEMSGDEALVMVKVANSTPEPDGTFKDYFLRVPPTIKRAREAVAWTFGMAENEYEPALQT
jgi:hypothetical protein